MLWILIVGCSQREGSSRDITVTADTTRGLQNTAVMLGGLSSTELARLRSDSMSRDSWQRAFRVSVAGDTTPIIGRYSVTDRGIQFQPAFPFDQGRDYDVVVDQKQLAANRGDLRVEGHFRLPAPDYKPSTRVVRIYPTADTLPENQLRFYVEFSAPMSREAALPHVKLLDQNGTEVRDAFLPLEGDFWNRERTRYTLFLDPGRVKRDILPNRQMGRPLVAGRRYSLVIDSTWRDGRGQPLVASYMKRFRAKGADLTPITLADWKVNAPNAGTRDPLTIRFPEPLDHGLLQRAVGVQRGSASIDGTVIVAAGERGWGFTPSEPWAPGDYHVLVLDFLEDAAGNRVNRPFEVDDFERVDSTATPSKFTIPFRIR